MYERMLDKQNIPSIADMTAYCGDTAELFASLNRWLSDTFDTSQEMTFPTAIIMAGEYPIKRRKN